MSNDYTINHIYNDVMDFMIDWLLVNVQQASNISAIFQMI